MKYTPLAVVLAALLPSLAYAQNTQFSDCRTLEVAGNNVGPDEALVDGMVCKVVKPKARSWVSSPASGKTAQTENGMALLGIIEPETLRSKVKVEVKPTGVVRTPASGKTAQTENSMALLGIIEPETLRSKLSAEANAAEKVATPKTGTEPEPETELGENVTPQSARFEIKPAVSLGEIARAYQKNSQAQAAAAPDVEPNKPTIEGKLTAAPTTTTAPETSTTTLLQPGQKATGLTAAQAPTSEVTPEETPATIAPAPVTPIEPQPAAPTEAFRAPQTPVPAVKAEAALRVVVATPATALGWAAGAPPSPVRKASPLVAPATTPEAQSDGKTGVFGWWTAGAALSQLSEAHPVAVSAVEDVRTSEPQKSISLGVFIAPETSSPELNRPPDLVSYGMALEDGFKDGQRAGCTKNVSLGSLDKERLFLAIPEWAANWYEKNQKRFPGMCFSDSPMLGAQNYLDVFYTSAPAVSGIDTLRETSAAAEISPTSGVGTFTTHYGSTWHYTFDRTATTTVTTVLTEKVPHSLQSNVLYATAYSEQGLPISQHWPTAEAKYGKATSVKQGKNRDAALPGIRIMSDLLNQMAEDIAKL